MVNYTPANSNEPTRAHVIIQNVDVPSKKATGLDIKANRTITINLNLTPGQTITWPRQSEEWWCTTINQQWVLEYKADFGNEGFAEEAVGGDIVIATNTGNIVIRGNNVRLANSSTTDIIGGIQRLINLNLFGSTTGTAYPVATIAVSGNYTVTNSDAWAIGVTATKDPGHMLTVGTTVTSPSYVTVPVTGRYNVRWHTGGAVTMPANSGAVLISRISVNAPSPGATIAASSLYFYAAGAFTWNEVHIEANNDVMLNAGDKVYWSNWIGGGSYAVNAVMAGQPTAFQIRYLGQS